jgi:hypothetical protein
LVACVDLVTDTDGDGFTDGEEILGWNVIVDEMGYGDAANGAFLTVRNVSSDPEMDDTDGDGLNDYIEYLIRTDPTSQDTDGDGLTDFDEWYRWITNPNSVDSDGDSRGPSGDQTPNSGLFDGNELTMMKTSPSLDDTDGDGWTDFEEADHPTRSPLVADLPKLQLEIVDDVDIRLDIQYAEEAGQTRQYGTEMTKGTSQTVNVYDESSVNTSLSVGVEHKFGLDGGTTVKAELTVGYGQVWATTVEDSTTAQESYSEYTTDSRTRTETVSTGSMSSGVKLKNIGNITFTLTDLGITVRRWQPSSEPGGSEPGSFLTLATLVPPMGGGITLAPGDVTPVLQVQAGNLNADRVKEFLAKPDSLYLEPATYEIQDAQGLNYDFLEETTAGRTARIVIDPGQGNAETYRIATNVMRQPNGTYAGVPLGTIMTDILGIDFETRSHRELEPSSSTNERVLYAVRDIVTQADPALGHWFVYVESDRYTGETMHFEDVPVTAGDRIIVMYVRDLDGDGLSATEEQHYRTDDVSLGDTDGDGLTDAEEVLIGWDVRIDSGDSATTVTYHIISDPVVRDQDQDGWDDYRERQEGTDPALPDTDRDGLADSRDPWPVNPAHVLYVRQGTHSTETGDRWEEAIKNLSAAIGLAVDRNNLGAVANTNRYDDISEIWVASGTYVTPAQDSPFELRNGAGLYGGFGGIESKRSQRNSDPTTNGTALSGDIMGNDLGAYADSPTLFLDNSYHVAYAASETDETAVLDGFMVTGGRAISNGGGMWSSGNSTLRNLFFRGNHASLNGGGLYIEGGNPTITNCTFNRNTVDNTEGSGGGVSVKDASPSFIDCWFSENEAALFSGDFGGGALHFTTAYTDTSLFGITLQGCWFQYNRAFNGSGILLENGTHRVENCQIRQNGIWHQNGDPQSWGGGLFSMNAKVNIAQSVIWQNSAWLGGGILAANPHNDPVQAQIWVINSSVSGNFGYDFRSEDLRYLGYINDYQLPYPTYWNAAGLLLFGQNSGSASVENSVFWDNLGQLQKQQRIQYCITSGGGSICTNDQTFTFDIPHGDWREIFSEGNLVVRNSVVKGLDYLAGSGNTGGDPKFLAKAAGDLKLDTGSSAIDFGSNYVDFDPFATGFQSLPNGDLNNKTRIIDGDGDGVSIIDMGAYEFQGN